MADSEQYLSLFSGHRDHVPLEPQNLVDTISRQLNVIQAGDDCEHNLVFGGEKKVCLMCQFQKRRTKAGWKVYSRHKCDKCDVSLCRSGLAFDCFKLYHEMKPGSIVERGNSVQFPLSGGSVPRGSSRNYNLTSSQLPSNTQGNTMTSSVLSSHDPLQYSIEEMVNSNIQGPAMEKITFPFKYNFDFG